MGAFVGLAYDRQTSMLSRITQNTDAILSRLRSLSPIHKTAFFLMLENVDQALQSHMPFEDYLPFQQDMGILMEMIVNSDSIPDHYVDLLVSDLESIISIDSNIIGEKLDMDVDFRTVAFATMLTAMTEIMERLSKLTQKQAKELIYDFEVEGDSLCFGELENLANDVAEAVVVRFMSMM